MAFESSDSQNSHSNDSSRNHAPIDGHAYLSGASLGRLLKEGDLSEYADQMGKELRTLTVQSGENPDILSYMKVELVRGINSTDPADAHVIKRGDLVSYNVDVAAERIVNVLFGILDGFSSKPNNDHTRMVLEKVAGTVNSSLLRCSYAQHLYGKHPIVVNDFIKDFNRRRLENNRLPNFKAYIGADGLPEIRYVSR